MNSHKYNVDYFIEKFEAIPAKHWTTYQYDNGKGQYCALGHCGAISGRTTNESRALVEIMNRGVVNINDNPSKLGRTPRTRILAVLRRIKAGKSVVPK
jgi:hypothetical protein